MRSKLKFTLAICLAGGFIAASHGADSRAVSADKLAGPSVVDTRATSDLVLAAKQKYPSPAERRCDVADNACQKRCKRLTKGEGPRGLACASDCTKQWEKCRKEAPGPQ